MEFRAQVHRDCDGRKHIYIKMNSVTKTHQDVFDQKYNKNSNIVKYYYNLK